MGLPAMRKFFTRKEEAPVEAKIIKTITPQGMANFLRPLKDDAGACGSVVGCARKVSQGGR